MTRADFTFIPLEELSTPPRSGGTYDIIKDHWWAVDEEHNAMLYRGYSRQCNSNKEIGEMIIRNPDHPAIQVLFVPTAYLPHNCSDYA